MSRNPTVIDPIVAELRARRLELGLTQAAVGRRMYVAKNRIATLETCPSSPSLDTIRRWAATLGMELRLAPKTEEA